MARGASSHFSLKRVEYDRYYPTVLGVLQNSGFLVLDAERTDDRAFLQGLPRTGEGAGIEIEIRRRPKGVDVHVLVVPHQDLPQEKGRFLMKQGVFGTLQSDPASDRTLADVLPGLRRDEGQRQVDPRFRRTPTNIPEWIFFNLKGGTMTWVLGTVIGLTGAAYLLFWAPEGPYRRNDALMGALLLVLAPWWSGIWGRSAARGLVAAFVSHGPMRKSDLLRRPVKDIELRGGEGIAGLVAKMEAGGGFTAKKVGVGVDILRTMFRDPKCLTFLSFPAALVATGVRGVLRTLVQRKLVDIVITTGGTADHDLARTWKDYYHGDFDMDDVVLHRLGVNRLGNVLVPNESYGIVLEKKIQPMLRDLWKEGRKSLSTKELLWEFGRRTESRDSLLWWAWKNRIPVYVPAIFDGAVGYQLWSFWQDHKGFSIDQFRDEGELSDLVFGAKESGALMIGGGVSKHHTIWWNQFRGGLDHAVYITTAPEWDGSLSGARRREGISWGKVKETAKQVTIEGDASAILPMMVAAALGRPHR